MHNKKSMIYGTSDKKYSGWKGPLPWPPSQNPTVSANEGPH